MSSGSLSHNLRNALQRGAEVGLARAIQSDAGEASIQQFIQKRLSNLSQSEVDYLLQFSRSIVDAAALVQSLEPDEPIPIDQIPLNPELPDDGSPGRRLFWTGQWNIPGTDEWWDFKGDLPAEEGVEGIYMQADELASGYIERYPGRFMDPSQPIPAHVNVHFTSVQGRP